MSHKGNRMPIPPLAKEEPVLYRPSLAKVLGKAAAALLEKAHRLQCVLGRAVVVQHQGRAVERVIFPWSPKDREVLAGWSTRQVRRVLCDLAASPEDVTVNPGDEVLLWQHSARDEDGRLSRDWFSVNYAAIGRACPLAAVHLSPGLLDPLIYGGSSGHDVQEVWTPCPQIADTMSEKFGHHVQKNRPAHLSNSSLNSLSLSLPPSARAREAAAVLSELGFEPADALGLIGRWPDGPQRARVMAANVALLRAAGYAFDPWPPRGFIAAGMRDAWPAMSQAEAVARAAAQHARRTARAAAATTSPASSSKDEALRQRIEAAGRRL